jgi:hypothetical protein
VYSILDVTQAGPGFPRFSRPAFEDFVEIPSCEATKEIEVEIIATPILVETH